MLVKEHSKALLASKGPARWLEAGKGHWPCPQLCPRSGARVGACTAPGDAARRHLLPRAHAPGQPSRCPLCPAALPSRTPLLPRCSAALHTSRGTRAPPELQNRRGATWRGQESVTPCPRALADRWRWRISLGDSVPVPAGSTPGPRRPRHRPPAAAPCADKGRPGEVSEGFIYCLDGR